MRAFLALTSALWRYAEGRRFRVVLFVVLFVLANSIYLFEPFVIGLLLNAIQAAALHGESLAVMGPLFLLMIGLSAGFWLFHGPARVLETTIAYHIRVRFVDHLYRILMTLPVQWHRDHHSGETINRIRKSSNALYDFAGNTYQFIEMVIRLLGSVLALTIILPIAAIMAVAVSIVALTIVFVIDIFLLKSYDAINRKEHHTASALHDYITNIVTVITLRLEKLTQKELWKRMTHYFPLYRGNTVLNEVKWFLATIVILLMTVAVLAWYAFNTVAVGGVLFAGTFFMLYEYLQKIGNAFYTFAWKYSTTIQQYADLKAADEIFAAERPVLSANARLPRDWSTLEIRDLQFHYEDEEQREHHLDGVSLTLVRGRKIALVGESGSGKSTLMSLLRGLHPPDTVTVICDGKPLKHGMAHLADHVTLIPQEPEIFANTIEYNITVDTEQSKKEILEDVRLACFDTVLERLHKGLDTNVVEKGVNLSGGEKQRLALARGIFAAKSSDILLLDEPTSSVDSVNERKIYENLFTHFADRCIVSSIHKLHLLPLFDDIYVLDQGRVIENGSFVELTQRDGHLSRLWKQYVEEGSVVA